MDDQPKEGGEGDKKIVHTYSLIKVRVLFYQLPLTHSLFNYQLYGIKIIEKAKQNDSKKDGGRNG
jgi:hypothetical protein